MPNKVTRKMADEAAAILKGHRWIFGVELFGSVARDGSGKDLDLIIISDDSRGMDFIEMMQYHLMTGNVTLMGYGIYADGHLRETVAMRVLREDFDDRLAKARSQISGANIDLFIFPHNWRNHLRSLQNALPHSDPEFMENIARDAVSI